MKDTGRLANQMYERFLRSMFEGCLPRFVYIADRRGRPIRTIPRQEFPGLDTLINTGYVDARGDPNE